MTNTEKMGHRPSTRIVAGVDFSRQTPAVIDRALQLADTDAVLHVVHVVTELIPALKMDVPFPRRALVREEIEAELLREVGKRVAHAPRSLARPPVVHVVSGDVAGALNQVATDLGAELIVVGTHGRRGVRRLLKGSVAEKLVRIAVCPVAVVRSEKRTVPELAPACPWCVMARQESEGRELWCEQHRHNLGRRHTYHFVSRNVAARENMPLVVEPSSAASPMRH